MTADITTTTKITPFAVRIATLDDPYVEQVVLLEGQGIWCFPPPTNRREERDEHQFESLDGS